MNKFEAVRAFVNVVEQGGFTAAGRRIGISGSAVTKSVARLEDDLGVQLFVRTTRQLGLTDYGQEFYDRCVRVLAEMAAAEAAMRQANGAPKGVVRALIPFSFGRVTLIPALTAFYKRYPEISLELTFNDRPVDLIHEGYDLAVRTGDLNDSRLITRVLTRGPQVTVASPAYLEERGIPATPDDLAGHNCVVGKFGPEWQFRHPDGEPFRTRVRGNLVVWNGDALREAAVAGIGVAQSTWWLFRKDLRSGAVRQVLPDFVVPGEAVSLLYPANRHMPAKTRALIDYLTEITRFEEGME